MQQRLIDLTSLQSFSLPLFLTRLSLAPFFLSFEASHLNTLPSFPSDSISFVFSLSPSTSPPDPVQSFAACFSSVSAPESQQRDPSLLPGIRSDKAGEEVE